MTEDKKLLPLGTAVFIKDDDSAYIIMARVFQKQTDELLVAKYKGVPHPWGENQKYKTMIFSENDIVEILQKGYETKEDIGFEQERREAAVSIQVTTNTDSTKASSSVAPKEKVTQAKPRSLNKDPFFKLRERGRRK